jgi:nucleoside-diphosphate-sugar epimerase
MKVFIAGATGVLGRRVVSKLVDRGHHVVGLSLSDKNKEFLQRSQAEPRSSERIYPAFGIASVAIANNTSFDATGFLDRVDREFFSN